jgi:drug/metabolite transporter (DMT)-like permease
MHSPAVSVNTEACDDPSKQFIIVIKSDAETIAPESGIKTRATDNTKSTWLGTTWVVVWFVLNVGLAVLMKYIFINSSFKFPVLLSTVHMLVGTLLSQLVMTVGVVKYQEISKAGEKRLRYFVFLFCLNIAFGNIAVKIVNLTLSQIIRSTIPVFIMITAYLILNTRNSKNVILSVIPVVVGVAMTAYGDIELTLLSLVLLVIGNLFAAFKVVITNKYLVQDKLQPMTMLAKLSPLATIVMFSFALINGEVSTYCGVWSDISITTYFWIFVSGLISFALNWTNFLANMHTSPLTMSVLGNLKQVMLVFLSVFMFNSEITILSSVGITIATIGMTLYSYLKHDEGRNLCK